MSKEFSNIQIKKLPNSVAEITGEISADFLASSHSKALKKFAENAEMPGFRKGKVPEAMLRQKIGEGSLLEEAANIALESLYTEIMKEADLHIIGEPNVSITKLALGNPLEFKITTSLFPEFSLPDYSKIAKEVMVIPEDISVNEKDVEDVLMEIRKNYAHHLLHQNGEQDHNHEPITEKDLPELTDELAKKLGPFIGKDDLLQKVRENVAQEKIIRAKEKKRIGIMDAIIEKTKIEVPSVLVQNELEKMHAQFKDDITRAGYSYEEYLSKAKKTEEEIKNEWKDTAEKRAKAQLVLGQIAEKEKITPDKETIEKESAKILEIHKDTDLTRVKMYVAMMLLNEKVFQFLEKEGSSAQK